MRLTPGQPAPPFVLPSIDGAPFNTADLHGTRYMLAFFRFASCPFCNLRVHTLVQRYAELGDAFTIVAIFDSTLDTLTKHAKGHAAPFPILADDPGDTYTAYQIERSVGGLLKGMVMRMPTLIKGMSKGYIPTALNRSLTTMPADFLIDEDGLIHTACYGADEGDHLAFDRIRDFALGSQLMSQ